jgi:hypothetical protein
MQVDTWNAHVEEFTRMSKAPLLSTSGGGQQQQDPWETGQPQRHVPRPKRAAPPPKSYGAMDAQGDSNGVGSAGTSGTRRQGQPQQQQQQQSQYRVTEYTELDLEDRLQRERLEEIRRIEQDSRMVKDCYDDVNRMVIAQQQPLDTAEHHVDQAANKVDRGINELVEARELQTKARKKMCFLLTLVTVIVSIIIVVVVIMTKHK